MEDSYNEYIEQLQKGSYEAFSELYSLYSNKLYSFVLAQTKNSTLSEDIVQETFLSSGSRANSLIVTVMCML